MTLLDNESYLKTPDMEASTSTVSTTSGEDYDFLSNPSDYDYDSSSLDEMETHSVLSTDRDDEYGRMSEVFPPTPPQDPQDDGDKATPEPATTAQDILENPDLSTVSLSNSNSTLRMPLYDSSLIATSEGSLSPCSPRVLLRGLAGGRGAAAHDSPDAVGDFKAQIGLGGLQVIAFGDEEVVPRLVEHVKKVLEIGDKQWAAYYGPTNNAQEDLEFYELSKGTIEANKASGPLKMTSSDDYALCLAYYNLDPLDHDRITARLNAIDRSIPVIPVIRTRPGEKMAELLNDIRFHHTAPIDYDEELKSLVPYTADGFVQLGWKDFRRIFTAQWAQRRRKALHNASHARNAVLAVMAGLWVLVLAISGASWYSRSLTATQCLSSDSPRPEHHHHHEVSSSATISSVGILSSMAAATATSIAATILKDTPNSGNSGLSVPEAGNDIITREKGPAEVVQRDPAEIVAGDVPVFVSSPAPDSTIRRSRSKSSGSSTLEYSGTVGKSPSYTIRSTDALSTGVLQNMLELLDVIIESVSHSTYAMYMNVRGALDHYDGDYIALLKLTSKRAQDHSRSFLNGLCGQFSNVAGGLSGQFSNIGGGLESIDDRLMVAEQRIYEALGQAASGTRQVTKEASAKLYQAWNDYENSQVKQYVDRVERRVAQGASIALKQFKAAASNARQHLDSARTQLEPARKQFEAAAFNARQHLDSAASNARQHLDSAASNARTTLEDNKVWAQGRLKELNKRVTLAQIIRRVDEDTALVKSSLEGRAVQAVARARTGRDKLVESWHNTRIQARSNSQSALRQFNRFKDRLKHDYRALDKSEQAIRQDYNRFKTFVHRSNDRFRVIKCRAAKQSHRLRTKLHGRFNRAQL
ncbi:hypothetical protein TRVA0_001S06920 [Trichomonascus vanleenenianus]|uniref:uncharacterized protein n=1 Tax=Trichomonascus vanleenenianus TaxID=2268995 RepID=UPI003EC9C762